MKINRVNSNMPMDGAQPKNSKYFEKTQGPGIADKVELSDSAKSFSAVMNKVKAELGSGSRSPEDAARIERIKREIDAGTYEVDAEKVAAKMLGLPE